MRLAPVDTGEPKSPTVEDPTNARRSLVRDAEEKMEDKVFRIWSVLSSFEESSAACISDMLLHVSNGAYVDGVFVAERFIWHVEILFGSADTLDVQLFSVAAKGKLFNCARVAGYPVVFRDSLALRETGWPIIFIDHGADDRSSL